MDVTAKQTITYVMQHIRWGTLPVKSSLGEVKFGFDVLDFSLDVLEFFLSIKGVLHP